jgi:hypothetical protein
MFITNLLYELTYMILLPLPVSTIDNSHILEVQLHKGVKFVRPDCHQ